MKTSAIVGHITRPNGSPIGNAEIWLGETDDLKGKAVGNKTREPIAKTDARGYFRLLMANFGESLAEIINGSGKLNISIGRRNGVRKNHFRVTGYLVAETISNG